MKRTAEPPVGERVLFFLRREGVPTLWAGPVPSDRVTSMCDEVTVIRMCVRCTEPGRVPMLKNTNSKENILGQYLWGIHSQIIQQLVGLFFSDLCVKSSK